MARIPPKYRMVMRIADIEFTTINWPRNKPEDRCFYEEAATAVRDWAEAAYGLGVIAIIPVIAIHPTLQKPTLRWGFADGAAHWSEPNTNPHALARDLFVRNDPRIVLAPAQGASLFRRGF